MSGLLLIAAFIGSVVMVAALFYFAIRRIRKKLASESNPTTWDFVNELGGYAVLMVIFAFYIIGGFVMAIMRWF